MTAAKRREARIETAKQVGLLIVLFITLVLLLWGIVSLLKFVLAYVWQHLLPYVWQHFGYAIALLFAAWFTFNVVRNGMSIAFERMLNIAVLVCLIAMIASFGGAVVSIAKVAWEAAAYIAAHLYALIWPVLAHLFRNFSPGSELRGES